MKKTPPSLISSIWMWIALALLVTVVPLVNLYAIPVVIAVALVGAIITMIATWRGDARRDEALRRIEERRAKGHDPVIERTVEPPPPRKAA